MDIPEDVQRRIDALERNDPDEAEEIATLLVLSIGGIPAGVAHYMLMLQDDPTNLGQRLGQRTIIPPANGVMPR